MIRKTDSLARTLRLISTFAVAVAAAVAEERQCPGCRIVVSIPDHTLALLDGDRVLHTWPIATGKESTPSPQGDFRIVNRVRNPVWYGPHQVTPPGSHNPLGTRWMGLSARGYGIHGTNDPRSIGRSASHGCIRMRNQDVEELFDMVPVGVSVRLTGTPPAPTTQTAAAPPAKSTAATD